MRGYFEQVLSATHKSDNLDEMDQPWKTKNKSLHKEKQIIRISLYLIKKQNQ